MAVDTAICKSQEWMIGYKYCTVIMWLSYQREFKATMGKGRDLTDFERGMVVGARRAGKSIAETVALLNFSHTTVARVYREWCRDGNTSSKRRLCGRKPLVDARGQRRVARLVRNDRHSTIAQLTSDYNNAGQATVSQRTMGRTLSQMGYNSRRPVRVPLLSPKNKLARLRWAQEHQHWTINDWKQVAWSDESRFLLHHADGRLRVWRRSHEAMDPACRVTTLQAGGGGLTVWGMFSWHTLGPLIPLEGCLNGTAYVNIVADQVHPFMLTVYPQADGYFQQDNAPAHRARITMGWFAEHDNDFTLMSWPSQSPDLNPIEHLWDELERAIRKQPTPPSNLQELRATVMSAWAAIPAQCYRNLVESMPRRLQAVLAAHGGPTRY